MQINNVFYWWTFSIHGSCYWPRGLFDSCNGKWSTFTNKRHHLTGTGATSYHQFTVTFCHASQPCVTSLDKGSAIESKACNFQNFDLEQIFFYYYYFILERDQISLCLLIFFYIKTIKKHLWTELFKHFQTFSVLELHFYKAILRKPKIYNFYCSSTLIALQFVYITKGYRMILICFDNRLTDYIYFLLINTSTLILSVQSFGKDFSKSRLLKLCSCFSNGKLGGML